MTSLLISFPDIPARSLVVTPSQTFDTDYSVTNLFYGERQNYGKLAASAGSLDIEFDLGTGITSTIDHLIVGGVRPLVTAGVSTLVLKSSSDDVTYTNRVGTSGGLVLSGMTFHGPNSEDLVVIPSGYNDSIYATIFSHRYWKLSLTGATTKYPMSKVYFGTFFDFGKEPSISPAEPVIDDAEPYRYDRGHIIMSKSLHVRRKYVISWEGVTDAKAAEFQSKLTVNPKKNFVFLYAATYLDPLMGQKLIHVEILPEESSVLQIQKNWNNITVSFLEAI